MKKTVSIMMTLLCLQQLGAQVKEGKITYGQKVDMYRRIPESDQQARSMTPPFRFAKFQLLFAGEQSLYKAIEEEPEPDLSEAPPGGNLVIRFANGAENEYYKNFATHQVVEKRELLEDIYLLEDSIQKINWKLEATDTQTIAGYACKKATCKTARGADVIAWYTEDIPLAAGPENFNGLPGMILGIDVNKGEVVFTALTVAQQLDKKELKAPVKGKKVTAAAFAKIEKERMGNGPVRINRN